MIIPDMAKYSEHAERCHFLSQAACFLDRYLDGEYTNEELHKTAQNLAHREFLREIEPFVKLIVQTRRLNLPSVVFSPNTGKVETLYDEKTNSTVSNVESVVAEIRDRYEKIISSL